MIKKIDKTYFLPKYCINVLVLIDILVRDEHAITITERAEEEFLKIMADQCFSSIKRCVSAYEKSPLPERFIKSQDFIITNYLPRDIYGYYSQKGNIYFDADAINGIRGFSNQFLFGHELGYKIQRYRDVEPCYDIIRRVYDTSEETFQRLVLSDIFGSIVSGKKEMDDYPMEEEVQSQLKLEALKSIYRV